MFRRRGGFESVGFGIARRCILRRDRATLAGAAAFEQIAREEFYVRRIICGSAEASSPLRRVLRRDVAP